MANKLSVYFARLLLIYERNVKKLKFLVFTEVDEMCCYIPQPDNYCRVRLLTV